MEEAHKTGERPRGRARVACFRCAPSARRGAWIPGRIRLFHVLIGAKGSVQRSSFVSNETGGVVDI